MSRLRGESTIPSDSDISAKPDPFGVQMSVESTKFVRLGISSFRMLIKVQMSSQKR